MSTSSSYTTMDRSPSYHGRWRRTRRVAVVATVVTGLTFGLAGIGEAQESPPETPPVRPGTATATAVVGRVAPGVGQLDLAITSGIGVTKVTNQLAQATAQTADLGLIGLTLTGEGCRGGDGTFAEEDLPQPLAVDNREGDTSLTKDEGGTDGAPIAAGRMEVSATADAPSARAVTTPAGFGVPGLLDVGGGRAIARTAVLPGEGREAEATVEASLDLAGLLKIDGMRWDAYHRTGVAPEARGAFTLGNISSLGIGIPATDIGAAETAINAALAPLGLSIQFPRVERLLDPIDLVRVTPLRIELRDSPLGGTVLGPVLDLTREQRSQLFETLAAQVCEAAGGLLVADVGVSIAAGSGFLTVDIGGVEAQSSDLEIVNPFGDIPPEVPPAAPEVLPTPPAAVIPPSTSAFTPSTQAFEEVAAPQPAARVGPLEEFCESIHPRRDPDCSRGAAVAVGVLGLVATVGVAGADVARQRRRSDDDDALDNDAEVTA